MNNHNNPDIPQDDQWMDDILPPQENGGEIGPDETAIYSAGLTHPRDAKVDQILDEVNSVEWAQDEAMMAESLAIIEEDPYPQEVIYEDAPDGYEDTEDYEEEPAPKKKRRPRRKNGYGLLGIPHLIATVIWLVIIVAIGVSLGRVAWLCAADLLAFGREEQEVTFTVTDQDTIETISENLKDAGLIRYPQLFRFYAKLTDAEEEISTGTFQLNTLYDYHALVNSMNADAYGREEVEVVIPEGYSCAQIFALLEENGVCTVAELEAYAANGELNDYWFLEGVERGHKYCLEGFLFPDTYRFYTNDDPENAIDKLLAGFDYRFTDKMKDNIAAISDTVANMMLAKGYDEAYVEEHRLTIQDIITVASMVEKETAGGNDSYKVAAVIYNRLSSPEFPFLEIDATVVYALGGKTDPLTYDDLAIDSPYNTYMYEGLPAGPISNPGRSSIYAALEPYPETESGESYASYYFYVYDPDAGEHIYAETYEEHLWNIESVED